MMKSRIGSQPALDTIRRTVPRGRLPTWVILDRIGLSVPRPVYLDIDRSADIRGRPLRASRRHVLGSKRGRQPHGLFSAMIRPVCLLDRQPDTPAQLFIVDSPVGLGPL